MEEKSKYITPLQITTAICFLRSNNAALASLSLAEIREAITAHCGFTVRAQWLSKRLVEMGILYKTRAAIAADKKRDESLDKLPDLIKTNESLVTVTLELDERMDRVAEQAFSANDASLLLEDRLDKLVTRVAALEKAGRPESATTITAPPVKADTSSGIDIEGLRQVTSKNVSQLSSNQVRLATAISSLVKATNKCIDLLTSHVGTSMPNPMDRADMETWMHDYMGYVGTATTAATAVADEHAKLLKQIKYKGFSPNMFDYEPTTSSSKTKHQAGQLLLPLPDGPA